MTIEELGQQIKQRYPQYLDMSNLEVGQKVLDKYPQYQDLIEPSNITKPVQVVRKEDFKVPGVLGSVGRFLGEEKLGRRIGSALASIMPGKEGERYRDNIRYLQKMENEGKIAKGSVRTLTTGGISNKEALGSAALTGLNLALPFAGKALSTIKGSALMGSAFGAAGAIKDNEPVLKGATTGALLGAAVPHIEKVVGHLAGMIPEITSDILARTTGSPQAAIKEIASAANDVERRAIAEGAAAGKVNLTSVATAIRQDTEKLARARETIFNKFLNEFDSRLGDSVVPEAQEKFQSVVNHFKDTAERMGVEFDKNGDILYIPPRVSNLAPSAQTNIQKAWELIKNNKDFTVKGINNLAGDLNALSKYDKGITTKTTPIVNTTIGALNGYIKEVYPELAGLRSYYADRSKIIDGLRSIFRSNKKGVGAITAAVSKVKSLYNDNNKEYREVLRTLDEMMGTNYVKQAAGLAMQKEMPGLLRTGIVAAGAGGYFLGTGGLNPLTLILLPFFSPRAVQVMLRTSTLAKPVQEAIMRGLTSQTAKIGGRLLTGAVEAKSPRMLFK